MQKIEITADTPLSALFRKEHHEMLHQVIDTWRPGLIGLTKEEALEMTTFCFDFDWIRPIEISNLSKSEATLYALLKRYKRMCK